MENIREMVSHIQQRQKDMDLRAEEMVASSWHGGQAKRFGEAMQVHSQDLTDVSNMLHDVVNQAQDKANSITNLAM